MHPTSLSKTTELNPPVQEHNAKTKAATNKLLQQKHKYLPSLKTGKPVYVQLAPKTRNWIPGHIIGRLSQRTYKVKAYNGGIYIRNRKFIKPRYVDSRQSLQTDSKATGSREHQEPHQRLRRATKRPHRLIETMN